MNRSLLAGIILIVAAITALSAEAVLSQSFGTAGAFTKIGFSPRSISMGNAMSASASGATPAFYNPALSAVQSDYRHVDLSTSAMKYDRNLHTASIHLQMPPSAGLSFHLMNAKVGNIDGRNSSGYHTGMLTTNEFMVSGQFGLRVTETFHMGIGFSWFLANYHPEIPNASSIGIDFGALLKASDRVWVALAVKDLLASYDFDTSDLYGTDTRAGNRSRFPERYIAGISLLLGKDLLLNGEFELRNSTLNVKEPDEAEQSADVNELSESLVRTFFRVGAEYHLHERFSLRSGLQIHEPGHAISIQPAAGFSLHLPYDKYAPSIDYAFVREPSGLSSMHVFALRFRL